MRFYRGFRKAPLTAEGREIVIRIVPTSRRDNFWISRGFSRNSKGLYDATLVMGYVEAKQLRDAIDKQLTTMVEEGVQ